MKSNKQIFKSCYYTYFVIGAISLMLGTILAPLIKKCGLTYATAGILLSAHSIGFLICSTTTGLISEFIGRKKIAIIVSSLVPIALIGLSITTSPVWLFIFLLITGFGRGTINNINNITVSTLANGNPGPVNILHSFFTAGGCISTLLVSIFLQVNFRFEAALYVMAALSIISIFVFAKIDLDSIKPKNQKRADTSFVKQPDFYIIMLVMFFYLCSETSISGWLTTYLKDNNFLSSSIAPLMTSLMWFIMIIGRLITAKLSNKVSIHKILITLSTGAFVTYGIFMNTKSPILIPVLILCIGLFLSAIYPTCVSGLNIATDFSAFGMGIAMGSAGLGSIIMPSVTGFVSDSMGISAGMMCILVCTLLMMIFSITYFIRKKTKKNINYEVTQ